MLDFKAPLSDVTQDDFCNPNIVFQMGLPPYRIDVLMAISGVDFGDAYQRKNVLPIGGLQMPFLSLDDLLTNKRESGREKDMVDVGLIERKIGKKREKQPPEEG